MVGPAEGERLVPHSTTVSPTSPYFLPVSLPNPVFSVVIVIIMNPRKMKIVMKTMELMVNDQ
jgi:hypothetical protein